ncbi:MAG: protein-L-isoaspartate(D-aspartate) O-methyltransferase [Methanomicrobiales archaeon]|nr:protein-L-isoaspartate(D-aspartate) O-methyltransferase [Methanomicrobiales archaeon]
MDEDSFRRERLEMVERQIAARGVWDPRVLEAMRKIPRHLFVPEPYRKSAYEDRPLPIGEGQTISQPYIVAVMTELLEPHPGDRVLEIGTGSGYQAALLSQLVARVVTMERLPAIAEQARSIFRTLEISNVEVVVGDGTLGWPSEAPYDAILITASTPEIPPPLIDQLAEGGRLVAPVGGQGYQELIKVAKREGTVEKTRHGGVVFVPLIGRYGWPREPAT